MREKLAAAAIAESEAVQFKQKRNEIEDENSMSEHESRNRNVSSDIESPSPVDVKFELSGLENAVPSSSLGCDASEDYKKQMTVDSGNDASSEDSNDSKGWYLIYFSDVIIRSCLI